jgi:membrane protease YdiL (CAAX protease family)
MIFFGITFALTWALFLPLVLRVFSRSSGEGSLLEALGVLAPTFSAFVLTACAAGWAGVRRLGRQGRRWRVGAGWYAFVLAGPGLAAWAGLAIMAILGGHASPADLSVDAVVAAMISGVLAGTFEEFGWSGFAFPALQARFGFLWAGVAMGIAVALWHIPFFLTPGTTQASSAFVFFLVQLIPARILFGWIYNGTGGSVLLTILFHGSWNAWGEILAPGPMVADPYGITETVILWAVAITVLIMTRRPRGLEGIRPRYV